MNWHYGMDMPTGRALSRWLFFVLIGEVALFALVAMPAWALGDPRPAHAFTPVLATTLSGLITVRLAMLVAKVKDVDAVSWAPVLLVPFLIAVGSVMHSASTFLNLAEVERSNAMIRAALPLPPKFGELPAGIDTESVEQQFGVTLPAGYWVQDYLDNGRLRYAALVHDGSRKRRIGSKLEPQVVLLVQRLQPVADDQREALKVFVHDSDLERLYRQTPLVFGPDRQVWIGGRYHRVTSLQFESAQGVAGRTAGKAGELLFAAWPGRGTPISELDLAWLVGGAPSASQASGGRERQPGAG